jgi:hypothetical protein
VRKLHLVVFSSGDFAMVEGESGEEVFFSLTALRLLLRCYILCSP